MGRPRRFRTFRDRKRLVLAYRRLRSRKAVARELGTTKETVRRVLEQEGEPLASWDEAFWTALSRAPVNRAGFGDWLKRHEGVKLKRSPTYIAYIAGYERQGVKNYLRNHAKKIARRLRKLPDLRKRDLILEDTLGDRWPSAFLARYRFGIDRYTFRVRLRGTLRNGEDREFPVADPWAFSRIVEQSDRSQAPKPG